MSEGRYSPTCIDCGWPRSPQSGERCRSCYIKRSKQNKRDKMEWQFERILKRYALDRKRIPVE